MDRDNAAASLYRILRLADEGYRGYDHFSDYTRKRYLARVSILAEKALLSSGIPKEDLSLGAYTRNGYVAPSSVSSE